MGRKLPQALLLYGPAGIGKFEFGLSLAKFLLCEEKNTHQFCGVCDACRWFDSGNHPDFVSVIPEDLIKKISFFSGISENQSSSEAKALADDEKKQSKVIRIDQIRELIAQLEIGSHRGHTKVALIYPLESMQQISANSLLKILEEPPQNVLFILITNQLDKILPTIKSRCQLIPLHPPVFQEAFDWLVSRLNGLNSNDQILAALRANGGGVLKTLNFLEAGDSSYSDEKILDLLLAVNLSSDQKIVDIVSKDFINNFYETLQKWSHDLTLKFNGLNPVYFPVQANKIKIDCDRSSLDKFIKLLSAMKSSANHPLNVKIQIQKILIEYKKLRIS